MSRKVGLNVALNLSTQGFANSLNKAKGDMRQFSADMKRQNEVLGKMGMGSLGRGFGVAGGLMEGLAMGGVAGTVAAIAAPIAALLGTLKLVESMNEFRRQAAKSVKEFEKGLEEGKVAELVTDQQSAFVLAASRVQSVSGPGAAQTFSQGLAATSGGSDLLLGMKGSAGALSNVFGQVLENPLRALPLVNALGYGIDTQQAVAAFDLGTAQNTAQAQYFDQSLRELQSIRAAMQGN
jgi:hypothetical protein